MRGKHSGGGGVVLIGRRRDGEKEMEARDGKHQGGGVEGYICNICLFKLDCTGVIIDYDLELDVSFNI